VRARVRLSLPPRGAKGSASLLEHLRQVERTTGHRDPLLDPPAPPPAARLVWDTFWAIYGGQPLTFAEIAAWSGLTGEDLTPGEAEAVKALSMVAAKEARDG
jgi:hypothetical protein